MALFAPSQWGSIYYTGQTITALAITTDGTNAATATGTSSYTIYDIDGNVVVTQSGLSTSATTITLATSGTWTGAGTVTAGWYVLIANNGLTLYVTVCPGSPTGGSSNLYNPSSNQTWPNFTGSPQANFPVPSYAFNAWSGMSQNRDFYEQSLFTPAQIAAQVTADPYFSFAQDTARPHTLWISTGDQSMWNPPATGAGSWQTYAAGMVTAGHAGATYEAPTNEFQFAGATWSQVAAQFTLVRNAILDPVNGDSTAKVIGPCSAGSGNGLTALSTYLSNVALFLSLLPHGGPGDIDGWSEHLENSWMHEPDAVMLRQYFGGLAAAFATAGIPHLTVWWTETGFIGAGQYGVYNPRREARERTLYRLISEQYGWPKEQSNDFRSYYAGGSGLPMFCVEAGTFDKYGIARAGIAAVHVMSEALYGTTCTPTSKPGTLSFGTVGDNFYVGSHYTSAARDVVVLTTNGLETDTVTLTASNTSGVTAWDGFGRTVTPTVAGSTVTVPVNDLLTYVFLASGTTVSVASTGSGVQTFSSATNLAGSASGTLMQKSNGSLISGPNDGTFAETPSGASGAYPYLDLTVPETFTIFDLVGQNGIAHLTGFAVRTAFPWRNDAQLGANPVEPYTAAPVQLNVQAYVNGTWTTIFTFTSATATSIACASASNTTPDTFSRITFWRQGWAWLGSLNTTQATQVRLNIPATSYGSQPDSASSAVFEENVPAVVLAEWQVYGTASTSIGSLTVTPRLRTVTG